MGLLDDRVCVINGGAGSLGGASARLFLDEGAKVMLVDLDDGALARTVAAVASPNVAAVAADVSQATGARGYIERTVARFGPIGGSVSITSGVVGAMGAPGSVAYVTAKHAQVGLMRTVAREAARRRIRVNTLHPGAHRQCLSAPDRAGHQPARWRRRHADA
jgi:NAD(P)-dependent dehydrogenase (short-subunit alcohol dehydrogenase family)